MKILVFWINIAQIDFLNVKIPISGCFRFLKPIRDFLAASFLVLVCLLLFPFLCVCRLFGHKIKQSRKNRTIETYHNSVLLALFFFFLQRRHELSDTFRGRDLIGCTDLSLSRRTYLKSIMVLYFFCVIE